MNDRIKKYLIIDANEIEKEIITYNLENNKNKIIKIKDIFEKYNIPEKYHKIIIKINIPFALKNEAEEFTLGFTFDITGGKLTKENNKKYIEVSNKISYNPTHKQLKKINFKTEIKHYKFNDIIKFLKEIYNEGYLENYLRTIKEIFDITLDLDYLIEVWHEEKNISKAVKKLELKYKEEKNGKISK